MKRRASVLLIAILAIGLIADRFGCLRYHGDDHRIFDQNPAMVTQVIDGDTVRIRRGPADDEVTVRLLGIDAAEMNYRGGGSPEHFAAESTRYLRSRVEGRSVTIKLEPLDTRDRYDRLLAYLYRDTENLNLSLVRDGQVYADRRFRHTYRSQFEQAETEARRAGRGLWKDVQVEQMPEWRRRWMQRQQSPN